MCTYTHACTDTETCTHVSTHVPTGLVLTQERKLTQHWTQMLTWLLPELLFSFFPFIPPRLLQAYCSHHFSTANCLVQCSQEERSILLINPVEREAPSLSIPLPNPVTAADGPAGSLCVIIRLVRDGYVQAGSCCPSSSGGEGAEHRDRQTHSATGEREGQVLEERHVK